MNRIGTEDSTRLHPNDTIQPISELRPEELTHSKITDSYDVPATSKIKVARIPVLRHKEAQPIKLEFADVVLMNPPFTSQNNLATDYKRALKRRLSSPNSHRQVVFWMKTNCDFIRIEATSFRQLAR